MSSRIQPVNLSKVGRIGPSVDGRGATMQRGNYLSQASNSNHHHAYPEYCTSLQVPPIAKKSKTTNNSPQNRPPPVPSILTSAASFDSGITTTAGQSPGRPDRVVATHTINSSSVSVALPRSSVGQLPHLSQHVLTYPPSGVIGPEGYSYHMGAPPLTRNTPYGEIYYQHPNTIQHGIASDPYLHYHQAAPYSGPPYYPYVQPWHHRHRNAHEASTRHIQPMMVSSSSVVNTTPIAPIEYVTELGEHDVLSGRGGATNSYRGNRAFRILVKEYQDQYLKAKKRDKPAVASLIVEMIRKRGGRFLRRDTSQFRRRPNRNDGFDGGSMIQWVDIGDDRAREKTCQALREGAPEIRRKGHRGSESDGNRNWDKKLYHNGSSFSFDDDLDVDSVSHEKDFKSSVTKDTILVRSGQQYENGGHYWQGSPKSRHDHINVDSDSDVDDNTPEVRNGGNESYTNYRRPVEEITFSDEEETPIQIRPWAWLLPDRQPVESIGLHQLSVQDRDLYLREFLPPHPRYEKHSQHPALTTVHSDSNDSHIRFPFGGNNNIDLYVLNHDEESGRQNDAVDGSHWPRVAA